MQQLLDLTMLAMQCSSPPIMANALIGSQMATALPVRSWAALACQVAMPTSLHHATADR
jgi:hypothetical protein